jgi:hypothetical protein
MGQPTAQAVSRNEYIVTGSEPSELKYLSSWRKEITETPLVVTSERGLGQWYTRHNENDLEKSAIVGDSPVSVKRLYILE